MKEKERERAEILKRLGLSGDATPDAVAGKIAQLRQNYEIRARISSKRIEAEEWLSFLDQAEGVLLDGIPPESSNNLGTTVPASLDQFIEPKQGAGNDEYGDLNSGLRDRNDETGISVSRKLTAPSEPGIVANVNVGSSAATGAKPKLEDKTAADSPSIGQKQKNAGWIFKLVCVIVAVAIVAAAISGRRTRAAEMATFKLGVFDSFSPSAVYAAKRMGAQPFPVNGSNLVSKGADYNLLLLPLATVADYQQELAGWRIVWVPDESGTKLIKRTDTQQGSLKYVRHTFGAHVMGLYRKSWCLLDQRTPPRVLTSLPLTNESPRGCTPDASPVERPSALLQDNGDTLAIAVHNPIALELKEFSEVPVQDPDLLRADVNVLLASPSLMSVDGQPSTSLIRFIRELARVRKSYEGIEAALHLEGKSLDRKIVSRLFDEYRTISLNDNIEFLYKAGPYSCTGITAPLESADHMLTVCNLVDDRIATQIVKAVRTGTQWKGLSEAALRTLCETRRHFAPIDASHPDIPDIANFERGHPKDLPSGTKENIANLEGKLDTTSKYCIIGHGDKEATEAEYNQEIGQERADKVAEELNKFVPKNNLVSISMGGKDIQINQEGGGIRRVEIKRLDID